MKTTEEIEELISNQEEIPVEFDKIFWDNFWGLLA